MLLEKESFNMCYLAHALIEMKSVRNKIEKVHTHAI